MKEWLFVKECNVWDTVSYKRWISGYYETWTVFRKYKWWFYHFYEVRSWSCIEKVKIWDIYKILEKKK